MGSMPAQGLLCGLLWGFRVLAFGVFSGRSLETYYTGEAFGDLKLGHGSFGHGTL